MLPPQIDYKEFLEFWFTAKYYQHDIARWEGEGGFHGEVGHLYLPEENRALDQRRRRFRSWLSNFVFGAAGVLIVSVLIYRANRSASGRALRS